MCTEGKASLSVEHNSYTIQSARRVTLACSLFHLLFMEETDILLEQTET